jgi:hypothetical protein
MYMYISEGCLSKIDILESTWIPGNHIPLTPRHIIPKSFVDSVREMIDCA